MPIERIEGLTYGVEDMAEASRFLDDVGLERLEAGAGEARFRTLENQVVTLRAAGDPALPPAIEDGSTLREIVWGVHDATDLDAIAAAIGAGARRDGDTLRATDPNGLALAFRVSQRTPVSADLRPSNQNRHLERINERLTQRGAPHPIRIIHVAYNITRAGNEAALAFYTGALRFKPVDKVLDSGTFLQSEGDIEHHNFFLCFRPDRMGINHIAMEVWDFDAVMEAGNHMIERGWRESRRPGRHTIGSNVYRFIHAPLGGRVEFVADMDRMDKTWETRVFEKAPPHHIWMMKSSPAPAGGEKDRD